MRILFFNRWVGCHLGGSENHLKGLASRLSERGHEIHVLTTMGHELDGYRKKMTIWEVGANRWERPYSRGFKEDPWLVFFALIFVVRLFVPILQMKIRGIKFDIVSVHGPLEGLFTLCFRWIFRGTPVVFILEGYTEMEASLARYARVTVSTSETLSEKCRSKHGYNPSSTILVGVDTKVFNPNGMKFPLLASKVAILTVSRLDINKGIDVLMDATRLVSSEIQEDSTALYVVGDGKDRKVLEKLAKAKGLEHWILFTGRVTQGDLAAYYRSAAVFVSCDLQEDQAWTTVQEAMSSGVPVIWTSEGAPSDKLIVDKWGLVVPPRRPDCLANAILAVINDSTLRNHLVDRGLDMSCSFDWEHVATLCERAYLKANN